MGYALHPGSAKMEPFGGTAMDAIALNPFGRNKEATWLFGAWASSRPVQWRLMVEGAMVGTRNSIYQDPEFVKGHSMPAYWVAGVHEALKNPRPQLPSSATSASSGTSSAWRSPRSSRAAIRRRSSSRLRRSSSRSSRRGSRCEGAIGWARWRARSDSVSRRF